MMVLYMKGIILAGGTGSRLHPLTKITNKHLLPIYDKPMIYYPLQTLVSAGITEILLVTGGRNSGDFLRLLANGKEFGLKHLNYTYQEGEGGIADALGLAEHFSDGEKICVILGDNIIEKDISQRRGRFPRIRSAELKFCSKKCPMRNASALPKSTGAASRALKKSLLTLNPTTPSPVSICMTGRYSTRSATWCHRAAANSKSRTSTICTFGKAR